MSEKETDLAIEAEGLNEFERQPVPQSALLKFKDFVGMYAGEHCAGTELVIGPLFVAAGVSAFDLIIGLLPRAYGCGKVIRQSSSSDF